MTMLPPPIQDTAAEANHYEMLIELAQRISQELTRQGNAHALKGGTGLRIGYGLRADRVPTSTWMSKTTST